MGRARGPIKFTCPAIDSEQRDLKQVISDLKYAAKNYGQLSEDDITGYLTDAIYQIETTSLFLEEIRSSNDELRNWGAEMEDLAETLQSDVDDKDSEIESLKEQLSNAITA